VAASEYLIAFLKSSPQLGTDSIDNPILHVLLQQSILLPEQLTLPSGFQLPKPAPASPIEIRWLEKVGVCIVMNEASAELCLPNSAGKIDFSTGFASRNSKFHNWCRDLFLHYWERGK